jgi:hypothetical protein
MTFDEVLGQIQDLLQREKRVSYRGLKRRFALDDEYLEDLKEELIGAKRLAASSVCYRSYSASISVTCRQSWVIPSKSPYDECRESYPSLLIFTPFISGVEIQGSKRSRFPPPDAL